MELCGTDRLFCEYKGVAYLRLRFRRSIRGDLIPFLRLIDIKSFLSLISTR